MESTISGSHMNDMKSSHDDMSALSEQGCSGSNPVFEKFGCYNVKELNYGKNQ